MQIYDQLQSPLNRLKQMNFLSLNLALASQPKAAIEITPIRIANIKQEMFPLALDNNGELDHNVIKEQKTLVAFKEDNLGSNKDYKNKYRDSFSSVVVAKGACIIDSKELEHVNAFQEEDHYIIINLCQLEVITQIHRFLHLNFHIFH